MPAPVDSISCHAWCHTRVAAPFAVLMRVSTIAGVSALTVIMLPADCGADRTDLGERGA